MEKNRDVGKQNEEPSDDKVAGELRSSALTFEDGTVTAEYPSEKQPPNNRHQGTAVKGRGGEVQQ